MAARYTIEKTDRKITLSAEELIFHNDEHSIFEVGTLTPNKSVGCFEFDGGEMTDYHNIFVLIGQTKDHIEAVAPRIRQNEGKVVLGQDNMSNNEYVKLFEAKFEADAKSGHNSGTATEFIEQFAQTFVSNDNPEYTVLKFPKKVLYYFMFYTTVAKINNNLDLPFREYDEEYKIPK